MITIHSLNGDSFTLDHRPTTVHLLLLEIEKLKGWSWVIQTLVSMVSGPLRHNQPLPVTENEFGLELFAMEVISNGLTLRSLVNQWVIGDSIDEMTQQYGDISDWRFSPQINDMSSLFKHISLDTPLDISRWNTHYIVDMNYMFYNSNFNSDISQWDVGKVKTMTEMFAYYRQG